MIGSLQSVFQLSLNEDAKALQEMADTISKKAHEFLVGLGFPECPDVKVDISYSCDWKPVLVVPDGVADTRVATTRQKIVNEWAIKLKVLPKGSIGSTIIWKLETLGDENIGTFMVKVEMGAARRDENLRRNVMATAEFMSHELSHMRPPDTYVIV